MLILSEKFVPLPIDLEFLIVANAKLQIFGDLPKGLSPFLSAQFNFLSDTIILNEYFFKMHGFLENWMYFLENWYFSGNSACFALKNLKKKCQSAYMTT